jgi:hypothetical protein
MSHVPAPNTHQTMMCEAADPFAIRILLIMIVIFFFKLIPGYIYSYLTVCYISVPIIKLMRGITMASRQSPSQAKTQAQAQNRPQKEPADRQDPPGQTPPPEKHPYGVPVPERLQEAIAAERDNLSKVEALLSCMVVALEYQNDPLKGPYYPAVAELARELVARTVNGLDPFVLRQHILGDKVEEVFCVPLIDQADPPYAPTEFKVSALRLAA